LRSCDETKEHFFEPKGSPRAQRIGIKWRLPPHLTKEYHSEPYHRTQYRLCHRRHRRSLCPGQEGHWRQPSGTIRADEFAAINKAASYTDAQLVQITLAIALTIFTNTFNRINDTDVDFPPVK
jgi:alkylhydroperoxidase family enzyme